MVLLAAAAIALAMPAAASATGPLEVGDVRADELLTFERAVLGPGHAAEHARARGAAGHGSSDREAEDGTSSGAFSTSLAEPTLSAQTADPAEVGRWSAAVDLPVLAINTAVLPTGKLLIYAYPRNPRPPVGPRPEVENTGEAWLWDPATRKARRVPPPLWRDPADGELKPASIWCSGLNFLGDGRVLVTGGNLAYTGAQLPGDSAPRPNFSGLNKVYTFNPFNETWTEQPDMAHGRWYPSQVVLPDATRPNTGRAVIMSGLDETGASSTSTNKDIDLFTPTGDLDGRGAIQKLGERRSDPADSTRPPDGGLYPHLFTMPSGRVAVAGPEGEDSWFMRDPGSPPTLGWSDFIHASRGRRWGTAVLLPGGVDGSTRIMQLGGSAPDFSVNPPANADGVASTEVFDEKSPSWTAGASMHVGRSHHNTVLLPDGSMVTVGGGYGSRSPEGLWSFGAEHKQVELFDPATNSWRLGPAQAEGRAYHSTAVLLPDGRVLSAGDDYNGAGGPGTGVERDTAEIYEPPYLHKGGIRPRIDSAPSVATWGSTFRVRSGSPDVQRAVLVAPASTTHAVDMNQRYVPLASTPVAGGMDVKAPPNGRVAPPGYYMLFLLDGRGVPSVARFVRLGQSPPQPGQIVVEKRTMPVQVQEPKTRFGFSGAPFGSFELTHGQTRSARVPMGKYRIDALAEPGWLLDSSRCDDPGRDSTTAGGRAAIRVAPGETVRCIFTSRKPSTVTIQKQTTPQDTARVRTRFAFTATAPLGSFELSDDGSRSAAVRPGVYTAVELAKRFYRLSSVACSDADSVGSIAARSATLSVAAAEHVRCTFRSTLDRRAPLVKLRRLSPARGVLRGTARDASGVKRVRLALARRRGARCRWWSRRRGALARRTRSCRRPVWMTAKLRRVGPRYRWRLSLRGRLRRGRYVAWMRALDGVGNVTSRTAARRARVRLVVRPRR